MTDAWKQYNLDKYTNISLHMIVDDGWRNAACRAMISSKVDVEYYDQKYHSNSSKKRTNMKIPNEITRGLLLFRNSTMFRDKTISKALNDSNMFEPVSFPDDISVAEAKQALSNVEHCVVGLVEHMAMSQAIFEFHFPWLQFDALTNPGMIRHKSFNDMETVEELHPWIKEMILQANECDMLLYNHMLEIFESELYVVYNNAFAE